MSSSTTSSSTQPCQHKTYRIGFLCCRTQDVRGQFTESVTEAKRHKESASHYVGLLQGHLSKAERERLEAKLKRSTESQAAWERRVQALEEMVDRLEKEVKNLCEAYEPNMIPGAFEIGAQKRKAELQEVWRKGSETQLGASFLEFKEKDPTLEGSFQGLDLSKIPATSDSLVSDGVGLQVFLKHGKNMGQRYPSQAIGEGSGPAIMSYGSALAMFGAPPGPGDNSQRKTKQDDAPQENASGSTFIKNAPEEPKTESEYRLQSDWHHPTEALLSDEEQWALFRSGKFMANASMLASQYSKLVAAKTKAEEDAKKGLVKASPDESSAAGAVSLGGGEWPPVEGLDWAGFANWIKRCRETDPKFGSEGLERPKAST